MKKLFLVPARGGSKGLPRKNILPLSGRPMIYYTLDAAMGAMEEGDELCISTEDAEIIQVVQDYGVRVPFVRPPELASDTAGSEEVIRHALEWYRAHGRDFEIVVLLQVTSPLRNAEHVKEALGVWSSDIDMVVSVKETDANPYYVLFEEDQEGFLRKSKEGNFTRRQDCPKVYEYNGAIYVLSVERFTTTSFKDFTRIRKVIMSKLSSIDIDDQIDFIMAEYFIKKELI